MSEFTRITYGAHEAILDPIAGTGVLLLPLPEHDVFMESPTGPHGSSQESALRSLAALGWELLTEDDGYPVTIGAHEDGREALALVGP